MIFSSLKQTVSRKQYKIQNKQRKYIEKPKIECLIENSTFQMI